MRGIRRAKGIAPNGKAPILTPLLRQLVAALPDDLAGLRDRAILPFECYSQFGQVTMISSISLGDTRPSRRIKRFVSIPRLGIIDTAFQHG